MRAARRIQTGLAIAALALALAPSAGAHAFLVHASLADGTTLTRAPHVVELTFTEDVSATLSRASLVDTAGRQVRGEVVRGENGRTLRIVLPHVRSGAYRLVWRTVATDDLHATDGSLVFGAGVPAAQTAAAPRPPGGPDLVEAGLRALDLAALAAAFGALALLLVCLPRALRGAGTEVVATAMRTTRRVCLAGLAAASLTGCALVAVRGAAAGATSPGALLDRVLLGTGFGQRSALREGLLLALLALVASPALRSLAPSRPAALASWSLVSGAALAEAGAGHAAALPSSALLAVVLMALHVLAAAVWTGGVATLAWLALGPLRGRRDETGALVRSFGPLAAGAFAVLVSTGLYALGREVSTPDALLRSAYGHALLVKLALAGAVATLGALHAIALHPVLARRGGRPRSPRASTLTVEAVLAIVVLGAAGLLVSSPPARTPARTLSPVPSVQAAGRAADLIVDVAVSPNRPGRNFLTATVLDSSRPAVAPITGVRFVVSAAGRAPRSIAARALGKHRYQAAGGEIDRAGRWRVELAVTRPGLATARFATAWTVGTGIPIAPPPRVLVSDRPLGRVAIPLALVFALLAASLAVAIHARRRAWRRPSRRVIGRAGPILALLVAAAVIAAARPAGAAAASPTLHPVIVAVRSGGATSPGLAGLRAAASRDQAGLLAVLAAARAAGDAADVRALWIANVVVVRASDALVQQLQQRSDVSSVTSDRVVSVAPAPIAPAGVPVASNLQVIGATDLWSRGVTGRGLVVANLDTGVDMTDPDLAASYRGGTNSWFDPYGQHATPADVNGHGTWTLGAAVGRSDTGVMVGVAPDAQWIAAKVFDDSGQATVSAIHQAFQWALDPDGNASTHDGAQVVDAPFALNAPGCDTTFAADIQALRAAGVLPVFAAGNTGPGSGTSRSPANNPGALSVGAVDGSDVVASFSSRGPSACAGVAFPSVTAPGVAIPTVDRFGFGVTQNGTSMAAPQVAGALALLLSAFPSLSADAQESALRAGALDLGSAGADDAYGAGRVNVMASYSTLGGPPPPPPPPAPAFLRDGFESGDLRAWSSSSGKGIKVTQSAALSGVFGLELTPGRGPSRVIDRHVAGQSSVRIGLKLAARSLAGFGSPWADVVEGQGDRGQQIFVLQMRAVASGVQIRLSARRVLFDVISDPITLTAGPHALEILWRPTVEGATLTLDGSSRASLGGLPSRTLGQMVIGAPGPLVWRSGTIALDDYESTSP
jgi:subtilisin family serine protease/putative copper export protein/methionine-rich copper-binding protein CopC